MDSKDKLSENSRILIIGAGTFGCSTALHLARRGYKNVTCFDAHPLPSPLSAGNDLNKTVGCFESIPGIPTSSRDRLKQEAIHLWKNDNVFKSFYHPVGMIVTANLDEPLKDTKMLNKIRIENKLKPFKYLSEPEDFRRIMPVLTGPLEGWRGYYYDEDSPSHGWVDARESMMSAANEAKNLGVKFVSGDDGNIIELIKSGDNASCAAIRSISNKVYKLDKVILCLGASADLIVDFQGQLEAKCFTLAHVYIEAQEREKFKNLPVIFNAEKGFFFEPDSHGALKICNEFPGFTNYSKNTGKSTPILKDQIPKESTDEIRNYLKDTMPELAEKELRNAKICWCTDSPDRQLIIDIHPDFDNLVLASGDSGRSFNMLPIIGKYVADVATLGTESLSQQDRETWKWRPETSNRRDKRQDRYGGLGIVKDLDEISAWENKVRS